MDMELAQCMYSTIVAHEANLVKLRRETELPKCTRLMTESDVRDPKLPTP
jgi:hypothetical protein